MLESALVELLLAEGEKACLAGANDAVCKGGSHPARREFIDVAAVFIRHEEIACTVEGQT